MDVVNERAVGGHVAEHNHTIVVDKDSEMCITDTLARVKFENYVAHVGVAAEDEAHDGVGSMRRHPQGKVHCLARLSLIDNERILFFHILAVHFIVAKREELILL